MLSVSDSAGEAQKNITFQLQSSMTRIPDLSGLVPGIDVALDLINKNSTILPDYHLRYKDIVDAQVRESMFTGAPYSREVVVQSIPAYHCNYW